MNIGSAISELRKKKGLTQVEFSKLCEISSTSLSQIELGNKRPNPKNLEKICKILEIPEAFLYFLSFEEADIPESKRETYKKMAPFLKLLITQFIENEKESV